MIFRHWLREKEERRGVGRWGRVRISVINSSTDTSTTTTEYVLEKNRQVASHRYATI
jgi:hypothetical protein